MKEIGERLKAARIAKGLSLEDVQQALKIRRRYLEAIEGGRIGEIPGLVYARGFIRSYARLLGVDVEADLVAASGPREGPMEPGAHPVGENPAPTPPPSLAKGPPRPVMRRRVGPGGWIIGVLVLVLVSTVIALARQGGPTVVPTHQKNVTVPKTQPKKKGHGVKSTVPATVTVAASGPATMTERGGTVISGEGYTVSASPVTLTVKLNGPCWIQVLVDGVYQTPGIVGAGTETFQAKSRLSVVLGAPIAVTSVSANGQAIHPFSNNSPTAVVLTAK